jgi:pimeloyl-ACP methyl ester carboxylesterase
LAQEQFGSGYFDIDPGPSRKESSVNPAAAESLTRARGSLITIPGSFSLVPGSVKKETARITVPVFIAVGERDICGPISEVASQFLQSVDFSCSDLKDTGHMHFVYGSRIKLFNDFKQWMAELN